ncbi:hypothetical protein AQJ43_35575 [Streptomyces avermitilis]|uniref:Uncharacterized protein n=1 Tax=Streptomyces avermitilis TaxID=33903 RepID=A0A4D4MCR4_STRAX|nr:hypothetical protein AQJ43_35575 [Streptomyces avermitilis]OOV21662.1 hypothetical protein SM007_33195 [Streptomyces avermitilis]BBJ48001.1 hypothetical protein SAVMC3_06300 [Streptomyces avermitilis]GDY69635.1 hypothetical protein SAV14893_090280 [Streptomyces avermitilis]
MGACPGPKGRVRGTMCGSAGGEGGAVLLPVFADLALVGGRGGYALSPVLVLPGSLSTRRVDVQVLDFDLGRGAWSVRARSSVRPLAHFRTEDGRAKSLRRRLGE